MIELPRADNYGPSDDGEHGTAYYTAATVRRLIAEAVEKEREAQRARLNLTLASPEMASAMKQLKERIATEPGYALGLLVDAGICNDDGTLTEQFGGGAKEDARQSASQRRQASAIIPPPAQGG